jgi:hypothetical protein
MKRINLLSMCALAACALALVALPVSSASAAAKKVLQLNEGETKAANEAPGLIAFELDTCIVEAKGHLTGNDAATVKLVATEQEEENCGNATESGSIKEASMTSTKKLTIVGSVTITQSIETGTCSYLFSKFAATFPVPGHVEAKGKVSGKLQKGSAKACKKTLAETITIGVFHPTGTVGVNELFNAALVVS